MSVCVCVCVFEYECMYFPCSHSSRLISNQPRPKTESQFSHSFSPHPFHPSSCVEFSHSHGCLLLVFHFISYTLNCDSLFLFCTNTLTHTHSTFGFHSILILSLARSFFSFNLFEVRIHYELWRYQKCTEQQKQEFIEYGIDQGWIFRKGWKTLGLEWSQTKKKNANKKETNAHTYFVLTPNTIEHFSHLNTNFCTDWYYIDGRKSMRRSMCSMCTQFNSVSSNATRELCRKISSVLRKAADAVVDFVLRKSILQ